MSSQTVVEQAESRSAAEKKALIGRVLGLVLVVAAVIWLGWQFIQAPRDFLSFALEGLNNGALYALIALGYTLVYGIIELINFSHGDLFMLTTVLSGFLLVSWLSVTDVTVRNLILMLGVMVASMVFGASLNMTAERVAYRRLRRAPKLAPLITAVGLSFIYQWAGIKTNGSGQRNWDTMFGSSGFEIAGIEVKWSTVVVISVTVPLLLLMTFIVQNTRAGKAMRATAQDQDAARLMGIDVNRTIAFTFGLGGAMAGAAGLLFMESIGTTRYDAGFRLGLIAFTAAVLGGIGNLNGAVLGGFLIGIIEKLNEGVGLGQAWGQTVVFTILILLMVFKPEGLLGKPTTEKV